VLLQVVQVERVQRVRHVRIFVAEGVVDHGGQLGDVGRGLVGVPGDRLALRDFAQQLPQEPDIEMPDGARGTARS
jgi:hypothetical protein